MIDIDSSLYARHYEYHVGRAVSFLEKKLQSQKPVFGVVLGSGLGDLAEKIENANVISYARIPYFPETTVEGHEGKMYIGNIEGVPVIGLQGRKHFYEVGDLPGNAGMLQVVFPVHVLAGLGVRNYFVTNAAGGLNQDYRVGDMMVIRSHINLLPNPLLGKHLDFTRVDSGERTLRFQPMNGAYDSKLRSVLHQAGSKYESHIKEGKYLAVTGPTYETEGECLAFRDGLGADAVGMSTAPEVIVARNRGMNVVGFSCITNKIARDGTNATNHEEVKAVLESPETRERFSSIMQEFFRVYCLKNTKGELS